MLKRLMVTLAVMAGFGLASVAVAEAAPQAQAQTQATPKGWNYALDKKGNRVAKGNRVSNPDGSWREEIGDGKCKTVREMTANGEYRESHDCTPGSGN